MSNLIFFDCETTGKAKNFKAPYTDTDNWPRITQLAWAVYTPDEKCLQASSFFIKPDGWVIEQEAAELTGITMEKCEAEGIPIQQALKTLYDDVVANDVHIFVAHNFDFDSNVIAAEYWRLGEFVAPWNINGAPLKWMIKTFCTMRASTNVCKLPGRRSGFKWPKLEELHKFLFGTDFVGAHAALNDVQACAKCYFELQRRLTQKSTNLNTTNPQEGGISAADYRDQLKPYSEHEKADFTRIKLYHVKAQSQRGLSTGALLFVTAGGKEVWVPKSQVRIGVDDELYVANWKYKELE